MTVTKLAQTAKSELLMVAVKRRERPPPFLQYMQKRLLINGSQIQCCNKLQRIGGCTKTYRRNKRALKRGQSAKSGPETAKSELLTVTVKGRERPTPVRL